MWIVTELRQHLTVLESTSTKENMAKYPGESSDHSKEPQASQQETTANERAREMCITCQKPVYSQQSLVALPGVYHKSCFRCHHCKKGLGTYAFVKGNIYCKPHFKELLKTEGNYDEDFGHNPRKKLREPRTNVEEGEESGEPQEQEIHLLKNKGHD